jgi:DNA-binding transcriptional ArsR family regulator
MMHAKEDGMTDNIAVVVPELLVAADQAAQRQEITAKFFHGLSDLTRIRIVELLLDEGEKNVSELVTILGQPQSRISNHLACLRWCGYVDSRREGKYIFYRVSDPRVRQLLTLARGVIADNAAAILSCTRM